MVIHSSHDHCKCAKHMGNLDMVSRSPSCTRLNNNNSDLAPDHGGVAIDGSVDQPEDDTCDFCKCEFGCSNICALVYNMQTDENTIPRIRGR